MQVKLISIKNIQSLVDEIDEILNLVFTTLITPVLFFGKKRKGPFGPFFN